MQKIVPHLWFDKEAVEATKFYTEIFGDDSKILSTTRLSGTPSGEVDIVRFTLCRFEFQAISAGPYFKPTPAISFFVNFDPSREENALEKLNALWDKLLVGGNVLMPLEKYFYSERYGWIEDKYGFSWQLMLTDPKGEERPKIVPSLLYANKRFGQAEEAMNYYLEVFKDSPLSKKGNIYKYPDTEGPNVGATMYGDYMLVGMWIAAMDGPGSHDFDFNEAVSLIINCEDQTEIDYFTEKLSHVPEAEQCGWVKDRFGISWQIVPKAMGEMMESGSPDQIERLTKAFLTMKKFDLAKLEEAFRG